MLIENLGCVRLDLEELTIYKSLYREKTDQQTAEMIAGHLLWTSINLTLIF